ncbi:MAG: SAM-dependent methyltransferase [Ornithinibacter sp.]
MIQWREAWQHALYGPEGFYRSTDGPAGHFSTATHGSIGAPFARAIATLADRERATHVIDLGCGRGELLRHLHAARPDLLLTGVEVVERPPSLPDAVAWVRSPGGAMLPESLRDLEDVLVVANEWLDVVPCTIAEVVDPGTLAVVLVDPTTGAEGRPGGGSALSGPTGSSTTVAPTTDELDWCARHWPVGDLPVGARVEIGLARDLAWRDLLSRVRRGTALAIDYGHTAAARPADGTLAAYRSGDRVAAVPDGTCDLTVHVAVDSLAADDVLTQREALRGLGLTGRLPSHALARKDPRGYLAAVARASSEGALMRPDGLGGFWWVLQRSSM